MRPVWKADTFRTNARQSHSAVIESLEEFRRITGQSLHDIKDSLSSVLSALGVEDAKIVSKNWEHHKGALLKLHSSTTLSALQEQWLH